MEHSRKHQISRMPHLWNLNELGTIHANHESRAHSMDTLFLKEVFECLREPVVKSVDLIAGQRDHKSDGIPSFIEMFQIYTDVAITLLNAATTVACAVLIFSSTAHKSITDNLYMRDINLFCFSPLLRQIKTSIPRSMILSSAGLFVSHIQLHSGQMRCLRLFRRMGNMKRFILDKAKQKNIAQI